MPLGMKFKTEKTINIQEGWGNPAVLQAKIAKANISEVSVALPSSFVFLTVDIQ